MLNVDSRVTQEVVGDEWCLCICLLLLLLGRRQGWLRKWRLLMNDAQCFMLLLLGRCQGWLRKWWLLMNDTQCLLLLLLDRRQVCLRKTWIWIVINYVFSRCRWAHIWIWLLLPLVSVNGELGCGKCWFSRYNYCCCYVTVNDDLWCGNQCMTLFLLCCHQWWLGMWKVLFLNVWLLLMSWFILVSAHFWKDSS